MNVYLGWDPREQAAYDVADYSIRSQASGPVSVVPLKLHEPPVSDLLHRPVERRDGQLWCPISEAPMATEFAVSRFVIPFVQARGFALFADCDILCRCDIAELFALADPQYAIQCVKHQYAPTETVKMDGQVQTTYSRKNWSSVVLWNCGHPAHRQLTLQNLNTWPGRDLHAFKWLPDEAIGSLPSEWNHLVGVTPTDPPKILHYTLGGPWLPGWQGGPYDEVWLKTQEAMHGRGTAV
jgi:hypothetical protein